MEAKKSPRFDLARIYALNVKECYDLFVADAKCIAKRIKKEKPVEAEHLAKSAMIEVLAARLNLYCAKMDGVRCVERGDYKELARLVITEAKEIIKYNTFEL